jgi:hypothetical protein
MNLLQTLTDTERWNLMVHAATKATEEAGYNLQRMPGRGRASIYTDNDGRKACIRTSRDRWIAFPPLKNGNGWKTLSSVDLVVVSTVDSKENPKSVEIYIFPAAEVKKRFSLAYQERKKRGNFVEDSFGMWVALDRNNSTGAYKAGSGIVDDLKSAHIASIPIRDLVGEKTIDDVCIAKPTSTNNPVSAETIAGVLAWARERVASLAGVRIASVKLDLKVEY